MTVLITLTTAGSSIGPFNLYTNIDGYVVAFETGVSKASLVAGYTSVLVPTGTTSIQVKSTGTCTNAITLPIVGVTTTATPTTTVAPTTLVITTTIAPTSTTTVAPITTTTLCAGIAHDYQDNLIYKLTGGSSFAGSLSSACAAADALNAGTATSGGVYVGYWNSAFHMVGDYVYGIAGTSCDHSILNGYFVMQGLFSYAVVELSGGVIISYPTCDIITTTAAPCINCTPHDVTIGPQIWTGCNLNVSTFRDGTPIPQITNATAWANTNGPAWCYYDFDPANEATYGKLYNIYAIAATTNGTIAPAGYHVPTDAEWTLLTATLGGGTWISTYGTTDAYYQPLIGGKLKETGVCHWYLIGGADNSSGFTAIGAGLVATAGYFTALNLDTAFGTSSIAPGSMNRWQYTLSSMANNIERKWVSANQGISVRLVKNV